MQLILKKEVSVCKVSSELHVSRKTIHQRLCRYKKQGEQGLYPRKPGPKEGPPPNRTPKHIEDIVVGLAQEYRFKGPITIADMLYEYNNIKLDPTTIFRILRRRHIRYNDYYKRFKRPKKLYTLGTPGEELQLDVSFPLGYNEGVVVYDAIDDCTRLIKTRAYKERNMKNSIDFVKYILRTTTYTIKAIRTDNGGEFSTMFSNYLESLGIKHIKNHRGSPEENGKIERYHRTRKDEDMYNRRGGIGLDDANYRLKLWEYYYNTQRKHRGFGMNGLTPIQKYDLCSTLKV